MRRLFVIAGMVAAMLPISVSAQAGNPYCGLYNTCGGGSTFRTAANVYTWQSVGPVSAKPAYICEYQGGQLYCYNIP